MTYDYRVDFASVGGKDRFDTWTAIAQHFRPRFVVEVGVWEGDFAAHLLREVDSIERYFMIDPWRHLDDWNKPANRSDDDFDRIMETALEKTSFAASRVEVLRGTTAEVATRLPNEGIDLAYIDGDHTLRGITLDLASIFPKMAPEGICGGDDFVPTVWQHGLSYEPTFVFPYAVYFAEWAQCPIHALPNRQFAIVNRPSEGYSFSDHVGSYRKTTVSAALEQPWRGSLAQRFRTTASSYLGSLRRRTR